MFRCLATEPNSDTPPNRRLGQGRALLIQDLEAGRVWEKCGEQQRVEAEAKTEHGDFRAKKDLHGFISQNLMLPSMFF